MTVFNTLPIAGADNRAVSDVVRGIMDGKTNNTGTVTLTTTGITMTTINNERIGFDSIILLTPLTANAASTLSTTYISNRTQGTATITHSANVITDKKYGYIVVG
jgi:hypothetical protein